MVKILKSLFSLVRLGDRCSTWQKWKKKLLLCGIYYSQGERGSCWRSTDRSGLFHLIHSTPIFFVESMTCLVYSVSFLINITKLFKNQENLKSFKLNENRLELNWTKFVMYNRLMNPKERTHLDGKATKCDYLRRKNKLLSKSRELKWLYQTCSC